jgi:hypothetical protein
VIELGSGEGLMMCGGRGFEMMWSRGLPERQNRGDLASSQ